ncbi:glycoside hydrolase family 43 protein [Mucilaginibacter ginsenosidivorax]|uniref:Glycosyl hydrolase n=1 Tax=Mucilaginibacter ginsenosidivorax TaxID=862126 RepID=A0A5B8W4S1_9SPHI|nr:glycoside hydrolase family 43 protein [Mucilaginibacter ginsenosidivorax]QEC78549.1 glycosyl hydrolase [Mucilaginibacter ginsenosidivorax]
MNFKLKKALRYSITALGFLLLTSLAAPVKAQNTGEGAYIFTYFKNNGEDGLHLAYSYDGLKWAALNQDSSVLKPKVGVDRLMRDPCVIKGPDGLFHMVWTVSWKERGIGYASSPDMIHWSEQQFIPVMAHEPLAQNCWAPEIIYNQADQSYMIYWATTIPGRFPETDEEGEKNHRIYYVSTRDFKTYTKACLLYDPGFNVIDATIQKDGNRYVMFLKNETKKPVTEKNIRVAFSKYLTKDYSNASEPITGKYWAEGPTAVKIDNEWVVYFDKYTDHQYGAVKSADLKNWTDVSNQLKLPEGIRHGTVLAVSKAALKLLVSHFNQNNK